MMRRQFEEELNGLKTSVLTMAGLVERSLEEVNRALVGRDSALANAVIAMDDEIDAYEVTIDHLATEFIVRHQPAATDLRFVVVAIKLGPELERIGDHAVNIAERVLELNQQPLLKPLYDLPRMVNLAQAMVSDAIGAYVARDPEAARDVIRRDDEVDHLYIHLFRELLTFMMEDPRTITRAINLIFVARFAERIADQATNIAEEVVYLVEGTPIRHQKIDGE
ncbi:MAG: phosphate signaling complex protein PhoU [Acidobacteria bacterium]|jgi:phosphate transport system protein|nr:phosphate signaling complex protein PhoU [Acidobacteriota bacterium]